MVGKKVLSAILMMSMATSGFTPLISYAQDKPEPILYLDFNNGNIGIQAGAVIENGNVSCVDGIDGEAGYFSGGSYLELFGGDGGNLMAGLDEFTVSYWSKTDAKPSWYFYTSPNDNTQTWPNETYIAILDDTENVTNERYRNDGTGRSPAAAAGYTSGIWKHIAVVETADTMKIYVNGVLTATQDSEVDISDLLGENSVTYLGKANWSDGEFLTGAVDEYKIYGTALTDEQIAEEYALSSDNIGADAFENIKDNPRVVFADYFNDETVIPAVGDASVVGAVSFGDSADGTKALKLDNSASYVEIYDSEGKSPLAGRNEAAISFRVKAEPQASWWMYSAPDGDGIDYLHEEYFAVLDTGSAITAERYKNAGTRPFCATGESSTVWKDVVILANENITEIYVNGRCVDSVKSAYTLNEILGENPVTYIGFAPWNSGEYASGLIDNYEIYDAAPIADLGDTLHLETDIVLPKYDMEGVSVEWFSSDESVITADGKITRPKEGKLTATLTQKIKMGNISITKDFPIGVYGYENAYDFAINVSSEKGVDIQANMYGLFFEDISYSADGGLYAEKVENRSFEQIWRDSTDAGTANTYKKPQYAWSGNGGTMTFPAASDASYLPLNDKNPTYLHFSGTKLSNEAYDGIYAKQGEVLNVSFWARSDSFDGSISAAVGNSAVIAADKITDEWKKYSARLTVQEDVRYTPFDIILSESGTVDFDMISCISEDSVCGVFRADLVQKLKELNPGFLRFPGGCIIEGYDLANRYQWKNSVGPVEERVQNWTRWSGGNNFDYNQSLGIGYYEYLLLCEYLNCDPVPVLNVGLSCEYNSPKETVKVYANQVSGDKGVTVNGVTYSTEFYGYIQDALDLIEFCNGVDMNNEWVRLRAEMGHEEPFGLTMLGIGNEQWALSGNQWYERYEAFEDVIHTYYPEIKLIGTSGPDAEGAYFNDAWDWIRSGQAQNDKFTYAVDEHYYRSAEWFLKNAQRYDSYDRGTKVFAGEYAANGSGNNTLYSAIAEASFMTGFERNADVVYMASYAPLFCRDGYECWAPNMIWFDDAISYGKPDYYVQSMYMNNNGDYTLKSDMIKSESDMYFSSVSYDGNSGDVIVKVTNPTENAAVVNIDLSQIEEKYSLSGSSEVIMLTSDGVSDTNTLAEPQKVVPVSETITNSEKLVYKLPSMSFAIFRVHTDTKITDETNEPTIKPTAVPEKLSLNTRAAQNCVEYEVTSSGINGDVYIALYDDGGRLLAVKLNEKSGNFENLDDGDYAVKAMLWENMMPIRVAENTVTISQNQYSGFVSLNKSVSGNPITGFDADGKLMYGGDPAPLVVGDTVYLYVGNDVASGSSYSIPRWVAYSSKDLVEWKYEGVVLEENPSTITWANSSTSAWAAQATEHNGKYYFYFCTTAKSEIADGHHCIGVAVADSPTGPFVDIGAPLVNGKALGIATGEAGWYNIDPTVWIDKDKDGNEHIYLNWGNTYNVTCELNDDMVSVKDINGDGEITKADFVTSEFIGFEQNSPEEDYREAAWLYRRKDVNGNGYGKYYMFFANGWRESYSYAVTDDPMSGKWDYMGSFMPPNATSNTSHGGVFDFKGKTYYIYHNGALPAGSGYRRAANIIEVFFNEDGSIDELTELSTGIGGWATSIICANGNYIGHEQFVNTKDDKDYPITKSVTAGEADGYNTQWELENSRVSKTRKEYVSIQSVNKPGLYICERNGAVVLTQDTDNTLGAAMTFITHEALNGDCGKVSFESLTKHGYYLTVSGNELILTDGTDIHAASFGFDSENAGFDRIPVSEISEEDFGMVLKNGSFEEELFGAGNWGFPSMGGWYVETAVTAEKTTETVHSGNCSLKLNKATAGQRVLLTGGKLYEISLYVKGTENASAEVFVANGTVPWPASNPLELRKIAVTDEWQEVVLEFDCDITQEYVICLAAWDGTEVYFDDVKIGEGAPKAADTINPSEGFTASGVFDSNAGNPILPGYIGDPFIFRDDDGMFYVYGTTDGYGASATGDLANNSPYCVWYSEDLVNWTCHTFRYEDGTFPKQSITLWAPSVTKAADGKYYMAYIYKGYNCYIAYADSPLGPWTDMYNGETLKGYLNETKYTEGLFDTDIVTLSDGRTYIVTMGPQVNGKNAVWLGMFKEDMSGLEKFEEIYHTNVFEGPGLFERNGKYYLTFSNGSLGNGSYRVDYAMSDDLWSGYTSMGTILSRDDSLGINTTGHSNSICVDGEWYICYHRKIQVGSGGRSACMEKMEFGEDGGIKVIAPTVNGARPKRANVSTEENLSWSGVYVTASSTGASTPLGTGIIWRPAYAVDRNSGTLWVAADTGKQWFQVDFGTVKEVKRVETFFEYHTVAYKYIIEYSQDGENWYTFADKSDNESLASPQIDSLAEKVNARYIKMTFESGVNVERDVPVGIFEMNIY